MFVQIVDVLQFILILIYIRAPNKQGLRAICPQMVKIAPK